MSGIPVLTRFLLLRDPRLPFVDLDLTDPETGLPLPEVCLVGPVDGDSRVLFSRLYDAVSGMPLPSASGDDYALAKFASEDGSFYLARPLDGRAGLFFRTSIEESPHWQTLTASPPEFGELADWFADDLVEDQPTACDDASALWIDSSGENELASFLAPLQQERGEAFHRFLLAPENRERTVSDLESDFEATSPQAYSQLAEVWNQFLAPVGYQTALADSGHPFRDGSGAPVPASNLDDSVSRALVRCGTAALSNASTLFLDRPEGALHPALASSLIAAYRSLAAKSARLIVATDSPLVAARFAPSHRIRLGRADDGTLSATRSTAPDGAGCDEILRADYGLDDALFAPKALPAAKPAPIQQPDDEYDDEDELADLIDEVISIRKF
ncbi:MAG TPA: hypothetical protein PLA50_11370 [Bacteroidia bacterium]|nr:hypothetical protein [Bacteroidia bacterium]